MDHSTKEGSQEVTTSGTKTHSQPRPGHMLITGASSGLGAAMAKHFSERGWTLTLAARREERLNEVANQCPSDAFVRPTDLSDLQAATDLYEDAVAEMGPIDVLINNAGIQYVEPYIDIDNQRVERLFAVNVLAPMRLQRRALEDMLPRNRGTIVNVSSVAGLISTPGMSHYNAAKAALASCSESLRVELSDTGVHVLTVYPGPVHTPMEEAARDKFQETLTAKHIPTGTPEGLAKKIEAAIRKRRSRVVYPGVYALSRFARVTSQWLTDVAAPPLRSASDRALS